MLKGLIAAGFAMGSLTPADAAILEFNYDFPTGQTISAQFYGAVTSGNIFTVSGSRSYEEGNRYQYEGSTSVTGVLAPTATIALDKSMIDLRTQLTYNPSWLSARLFGVGDAISGGLGYDAVAYDNQKWVPFDPSKLTLTLLQDAKLDFSYFDPTSATTTTGTISGWVTPDGSRFEVGGLSSINGSAPPAGLLTSGFYGLAPSISLDKSNLNAAFYSNPDNKFRDNYLLLNRGSVYANIEFPDGLFANSLGSPSSPVFGNLVTSNLTLQVEGFPAAVPEPTNWALMVSGFGLAGAAMRRRGPVRAAGQVVARSDEPQIESEAAVAVPVLQLLA